MQEEEPKIPFHTRLGLRLLQVLLIVLALLLVKRCVNIYHDNKLSNEQLNLEYFDKGLVNGMNKAQGGNAAPEPQFSSYALKKAYRDGYRQGWDKGRNIVDQQQ